MICNVIMMLLTFYKIYKKFLQFNFNICIWEVCDPNFDFLKFAYLIN